MSIQRNVRCVLNAETLVFGTYTVDQMNDVFTQVSTLIAFINKFFFVNFKDNYLIFSIIPFIAFAHTPGI